MTNTGVEGNYSFLYRKNAFIYDGKNNFLTPATHYLNVAVNFSKKKKHGTRTLSLSIYNVYNRKNPYYIYLDVGNGSEFSIVMRKFTLFPIMPSISYSFRF